MNSASVDESVIGVQAPAGFWDPLDFSATQPEGFERRRAVERKHGRIAMVAMTGCLLHNADVEFPGYLSVSQQLKFSDIPNGGQGIFAVPPAGLAQILAFCALVELAWWPANKYDGDYGCGFFGSELDAEKKTQKLNAELANGRLAMLGIFGNMVAEAQTGQTLGEQMGAGNMTLFFVNPTTAPQASTALNASSVDESVIGVRAPAGFWDPLDFSTTQPEGFERRRAVERKHGRIAMVAMTGCLIHNADVEFPGYLSVSQQLKFSDIPNGGQGIFAVPPQGLAQILAFAALVELAWWPANKCDGDYGCGFFGSELGAEKKTEKLNAEMANGRLAMLGIFGNMVAEAQTGQTFGEQMAAGNMVAEAQTGQ